MRYVLFLLLVTGQGWQREMVDLHNQLRRRHDLHSLQWSDELAGKAQRWAETLLESGQLRHDPSRHGQNIFAMSGRPADVNFVFRAWASEASDYDYSRNTCSATCGHYTQIVWRDTKQIGCGVARGSGREIWVCDYDPPGNVNGERPY